MGGRGRGACRLPRVGRSSRIPKGSPIGGGGAEGLFAWCEFLLFMYLASCMSPLFINIPCSFWCSYTETGMGQSLQIEGPPGTQLVAVHVCETRVN